MMNTTNSEKMDCKEIEITTFINPHKFWIFEKENEVKRNELQTLINTELSSNLIDVKPCPEMSCIAFHKSKFKRAVIEEIKPNGKVIIWLLDYGSRAEATKIFKISNSLLKIESFIKQACLQDIIPSVSRVHIEDFTLSCEIVDDFTPGCIKTVQDHLMKADKLEFVSKYVYKDIYCGEIILHNKENNYPLVPLLVEMKHVTVKENQFETVLDSIALTSSKQFLHEILKDIDDDEITEGFGRASTRHKAPAVANNKNFVADDDEYESGLSPIVDSDNTSSFHLDSSAFSADDTKSIETKSSDKTNSDFWDSMRSENKSPANFKPPEYQRCPSKPKVIKSSGKPFDNRSNSDKASDNRSNSHKAFDNRSVSDRDSLASSKYIEKKSNIKYTCDCESCENWRTCELGGEKLEFANPCKKERRKIVKPKFLFKMENESKETSIQSLKFFSISQSQRLITPTLLVHGYTIPSPVQIVGKAPFNTKVHNILRRLHYEKPKPVQTYSWPGIMRHLNICVINAPKTGKTMTYIPAIASFIIEKNERYPQLLTDNGPIVIILCSSCNVAETVYAMIFEVMYKIDSKIKVSLAIPPLDRETLNQFERRPCDILIATPLSLLNLLNSNVINMKRLCHLVFENIDVLLERLNNELNILLNGVQNMLEHRNFSRTVQLVFTSERWTTKIEKLFARLESVPLICIGQHLEAALYGKLDLQMHFISTKKKKNVLIDILKDKSNYFKTLVICENEEEIAEIERVLIPEGKSMIALRKSFSLEMIKEYEMVWENSKNDLVFICTDEIYNCYLNITNAGLLINYSLPKDSWTTFCKRFKSLIDNYTSPFENQDKTLKNKVHVFVDENCENQFPRLQNFLNKTGSTLPNVFTDYCKNVEHKIESNKTMAKVKLCNNLKIFGHCKEFNCIKRHHLSEELDNTPSVPDSGTIHFRISNIIDVTTFAAHLIKHIDIKTGTEKKFLNQTETIEKELSAIFQQSKAYPPTLELKKWYVWEENLKDFKRCEIISIIEEEKITKQPHKVKIELIDHGRIVQIPAAQLYDLPQNFKTIPKQALIIHLANFVPPEKDLTWRKNLKTRIKELFEKQNYEDEDTYFISTVLLRLGDNIWVKDLHLKEDLHVTNVTITKLTLRNILTKRNYGIYTEQPLKMLYNLCKEFNITLPEYEVEPLAPVKFEQEEPQWAYLEYEEFNEIYFSSAINPDKFYVRLKKYEDIFRKFQDEIQHAIKKPLYRTEFPIELGKYYLAKDPDGNEYSRVKIIQMMETEVECFFVDFGDTSCSQKVEIKYLPDKYITKLPFQAIECSLFGISPALNKWDIEAVDIMYNYSLEPDTDYFRTLHVKIMDMVKVEEKNAYSVVLFDNFTEKTVNVNKIIVECGFAVYKESDLETMNITISKDIVKNEEKDDGFDDDDDEFDWDNDNKENFALTQKDSIVDDNFNEDDWDFEVFDTVEFLKEMKLIQPNEIVTKLNAITENEESNECNSNDSNENNFHNPPIPPVTHETKLDYCSPDILWYQTDRLIKMEIYLSDVQDYDIKLLRGNIFHFKTVCNSKEYRANITLFKSVAKTFQHTVFGQYIRIIMTKVDVEEWPRLTLTTERMRNVRYDVEKSTPAKSKPKPFLTIDVDVSDNEEELLYEIGSDEDYSESDIESDSDE